MDREPSDIGAPSDGQAYLSENERLDALIASLPPPPGIKHIDDEDDDEERSFGDVEAMIAVGRAYRHETVAEWLRTWGQPDQKPFKEWLADQDG